MIVGGWSLWIYIMFKNVSVHSFYFHLIIDTLDGMIDDTSMF